ncbi:MAG TPA: YHS domain-containing protein [Nitrososphaerales archaeon]|nr:YHS domain-containing protein [Nitrososphaerales archaeon]
MAKDPVCGMYVIEGPQALKADVKGTTFYFCSEVCGLLQWYSSQSRS